MKALIIDDEPLARSELRRLLKKHPAIEVVGEADNADDARKAIREHKPALLFLDVQMPEENGFELLASLADAVPAVIFTTAFDEYALKAFEFGALDYLMKPIEPERLAEALARANTRPPIVEAATASASSGEPEDPDTEPEPLDTPLKPGEKVFVRDGERCWFVPVEAVRGIEADGNHARLWLPGSEPYVHRTLAQLEQRLPPEIFFRASRSQIINLRAVETVEPWFSGSLRVKLQGGKVVEMSRRQSRLFRQRLGL
ncbi:MAG: LytTR family DNA-binding domain-containing protein [Nibricoccus sp.]